MSSRCAGYWRYKLSRPVAVCVVLFLCLCGAVVAGETSCKTWDTASLFKTPKVYDAPKFSRDGVKAVFYEGEPWMGKPTRVFAYYGVPKIEAGKKVPGIVLVHGGLGSAYLPWVKLWVNRGYAAIAMDTCGCETAGDWGSQHPRHEWGGPPGWGGFAEADEPLHDQWPYHGVADVILAHSLLRSLPEVDASKIGVTGISWGGYLTCIAASVDSRFKFAVPVYGCGFLRGESALWEDDALKEAGLEKATRWIERWDPSIFLPEAKMPMLWVTGSNDFAFPMDSLQKSYRLPKSSRTLCVRLRMPHGHGGAGENPAEILAFAKSVVENGPKLAKIEAAGRDGQNVWATFQPGGAAIVRGELNYTTDSGKWLNRKWDAKPATLDANAGKVTGVLPPGTTTYYFHLVDANGLLVSTEHEELGNVKK